jgi:hypothetical protein
MSGHPRFYELLDEMKAMHDKKNADYAETDEPLSNFRLCENYGVSSFVGTVVRISDKYSRLTQLVKKIQEGKGPSVSEERITDTLMDLAVYCLIARILYEEGKTAMK